MKEEERYFDNPNLLEIDLKCDPNQVKQIFSYDCDDWLPILVSLNGRTFPWRPWSVVMLVTILYVLADTKYNFEIFRPLGFGTFDYSFNPVVHSTVGIVLGFLIVYQSSQSSARW